LLASSDKRTATVAHASTNSTAVVRAQVAVGQRHTIVALLAIRQRDYRLVHLQKSPCGRSSGACHTPSGQSSQRTGSWQRVGQSDGRLILIVLNWRFKSDHSDVIHPSISLTVAVIWMYSNVSHTMELSSSGIDGSGENTEIVIGWPYRTVHAVGSGQYLGGSDDGAAAHMSTVQIQGNLPREFAW